MKNGLVVKSIFQVKGRAYDKPLHLIKWRAAWQKIKLERKTMSRSCRCPQTKLIIFLFKPLKHFKLLVCVPGVGKAKVA